MTARCAVCGGRGAVEPTAWRCACGGPWALEPVPAAAVPPRAADPPSGLWRYRAVFPELTEPLTLGEGWTPLVPCRDGRVWFKLESLNPTGSFKDRGAALLVACLAARGARELAEDSSGNAGAAVAAYAARAGLRARIYVPAGASGPKLAQIAAYGADVVRVEGPREAVARAAQADPGVYASHCWHPLFFHGTKTVAYELWEQAGGRLPDWVVVPVGHGTLLLGLALGFAELRAAGAAAAVPRLVGVQAAGSAPLAGPALGHGAGSGETVAEGIRIREPVRAAEILAAVAATGGRWAVVDDGEILAARRRLGAEGFFVEPTAAVAAAAAWRLLAEGSIPAGERVVVVLTGHGLKTA